MVGALSLKPPVLSPGESDVWKENHFPATSSNPWSEFLELPTTPGPNGTTWHSPQGSTLILTFKIWAVLCSPLFLILLSQEILLRVQYTQRITKSTWRGLYCPLLAPGVVTQPKT